MAEELMSGELWEIVGALLPAEELKPEVGRPCMGDRVALSGIILQYKDDAAREIPPEKDVLRKRRNLCWR